MSEITAKQEKFILSLLDASNIKEACEMAKISYATGRGYLADENFQKHYKAFRRDIMTRSAGRFQNLMLKGIAELEKILDDPKGSPFAKIQVMQIVTDKAYKAFEIEDTQERLEEIEKIIEKLSQEKGEK